MNEWRLAEAKNKLSELVNNALLIGPQMVRRHDDRVIVISKAEYDRLTGHKPDFKAYLLNPPHSMEGVDIGRDQSPMRDIDL